MQNLLKNLILLNFFFIISCASKTTPQNMTENIQTQPKALVTKPMITPNNCICVQLWMPVCGVNGKTYSNSCFAKCAGVEFKQGSCSQNIND